MGRPYTRSSLVLVLELWTLLLASLLKIRGALPQCTAAVREFNAATPNESSVDSTFIASWRILG